MRPLLLGTAALLTLTLTACGSSDSTGDKPAKVQESASESVEDIATSEPAEEPSESVPLETTFTLGDVVELGDWSVKVTDVQLNANKILASPDFYNEKPDEGQYLLATYEATYNGDARTADVIIDLTWSYTTTDQIVHEIDYQTTPGDDVPDVTRTDGTLKKDVEFDLDPALIKGGVLTVSAMDENFDTTYADFPVE